MKEFIIGAITGTVMIAGFLAPTTPIPVDCPGSSNLFVYDTPSGFLDEGYFDVENMAEPPTYNSSTSTMKKWVAAHIVGRQAVTYCHDKDGNQFVITISQEEYQSLSLKDAPPLLKKTVNESLMQVITN